MSDHPAVLAHYNWLLRLGTAYPATPEDLEEEKLNIPNHSQLVPYLEQLPRDRTYRVLDAEGFDDSTPIEDRELETLLGEYRIGMNVEWFSQGSEKDGVVTSYEGYGGCCMIQSPLLPSLVGLQIYVNGCEMQSAPSYYVIAV